MTKKVNKATFSYGGVQINLTKSKDTAAVQYTGEAKTRSAKRSGARGASAPPPTLPIRGFELIKKRGMDQQLDKIRSNPDVAVGTHVWHMDEMGDAPFIPTGNLYIEFLADSDILKQRSLLEDLGLNIKETVGVAGYRVSVTADSPNPIKCAMQLQKNKMVQVAEPEFATLPAERSFANPTGQFIGTQWHHENTGTAIPIVDIPNAVFGNSHFKKGADAKVKEAWRFLQSLGDKSLKIAVIDTGFATNHPQLRGDGTKVRNPFNADKRTSDVSPLVQYSDGSWGVMSHGTSCAAVAAGSWDNKGVLGVSPNARIIPIKLDILSDEAIKSAFEHAFLNGADIISCSLGYPKPVPLSTFVSNYITKVAREGRGGRGIPMFFAAGNANPASDNRPRAVSDFAAHPEVFCVTASNSLDERSDYSFFGPNAFLSGPTNGNDGVGITTATCDLSADGRSVELLLTSGFGGTSSAAPLVAGVCALMLTANPDLSVANIRSIFKQTCDKIGPAGTYNANGHSQFLGYGRINALKAVQAARALQSGGTVVTPTPTPAPTSTPTSTPTPAPAPTGTGLQGKVISPTLNVRTGPASSNAKVGELKQGNIVSLLEKVGGWWRIGVGQFVSGDFIQVISAGGRPGRVVSATLNVRNGPSVASPKVAELKQGASVSVFETSGDGWHRIGDGRWVLGKFVQLA